jgi:hypothetical protein
MAVGVCDGFVQFETRAGYLHVWREVAETHRLSLSLDYSGWGRGSSTEAGSRERVVIKFLLLAELHAAAEE